MRFLLFLLIAASAGAQSGPSIQISHTTESLRGVSAVSHLVAWASGTHGTYLRTTDGGSTWTPAQVPDATTLDFRGIVAFSADEAFLMSSGPGDQSRIYHTTDGGQHWQVQFANANPKGFFDSIAFWDAKHGIVLGDPIPDENGKLKFELLLTDDGQTWHQLPPSQLPEAAQGEGAFAASNSCIAILPMTGQPSAAMGSGESRQGAATSANSVLLNAAVARAKNEQPQSRRIPIVFASFETEHQMHISHTSTTAWASTTPNASTTVEERFSAASDAQKEGASAPAVPDPNIWFATGGKVSRVFHSPDRGQTWQVFNTPILHGPDSAGIFSIAFRDAQHGVIAGGDYKRPRDDGPNLAFTNDGGKTWALSDLTPQAYFSGIAYDREVNQSALKLRAEEKAAEESGKKTRTKPTDPERLFIVGQDFIFDFRPPSDPRRIGGKKQQGFTFNAVSPYPQGGALIVGPKGTIASIP